MEIPEKTPAQKLLTQFYSIQARLRRSLPPEQKYAAQLALERTRAKLKEIGVQIPSR